MEKPRTSTALPTDWKIISIELGALLAAIVNVSASPMPTSLPLKERVTILDFWATTCGPCRPALITLQALHVRYPQLLVQGINMDGAETLSEVKPLLYRQGVTYPVRVAPTANARLAQAFGVQTYPALFLLDRQGKAVWSHSGPLDARAAAALSRRIAQVLAAPVKSALGESP